MYARGVADGPYLLPTEATYQVWAANVKNKGGVVTRIGSGMNAGAKAARFPATPGLAPSAYTYVIAPIAVLAWDAGVSASYDFTKELADLQQFIRDSGSSVAENIGDVVGTVGAGVGRGLVSISTGWWWLLAAGGLYFAWPLLRGARARAGTNPPRRRRPRRSRSRRRSR